MTFLRAAFGMFDPVDGLVNRLYVYYSLFNR